MTIMSIFAFIYGLIQFHFINLELESKNIFLISDKPQFRVTAMFENANYYATILEFVILLAFYKMFLVKNKESSFAYYFTIIIMNIFMLYLTGCRTAWVALFITIPIMFLFQRKFYFGISLIIISILGFYVTLSFEIIPRIDSLIKDFHIRLDIWSVAMKGFLNHPLFGIGPFGYQLLNPKIPHAHSIYFDSLLSYGLVGCLLFLFSFIVYLKTLLTSYHKEVYSFSVGCILIIIIHGITDLTILNTQVGMLFLIIISSIHIQDFDK